jgi:DNA-directed RNA polymerase subunit RPC12/RpoP
MGADFRCENCGKLLTGVEAEFGSTVKCPHCHKKIAVPAGLAALPRPQVPTGPAEVPAPVPQPAPEAQGHQMAVVEEAHEDAVMTVMARFMPWLISIFFHVGLAMIMLFMVMIAAKTVAPPPAEAVGEVVIPGDINAPFSDTPGGIPNPGSGNPNLEARQSRTKTDVKDGWAQREGPGMSIDIGGTGKRVDVIGGGGGGSEGGVLAPYGLGPGGGAGAGPKSSFFGNGGNAHHIVYVIDRSGSMVTEGVFDIVKAEILKSIGKLRPVQGFHVILFSDAKPIENPPRKMVPANTDNKRAAAEFLEPIIAEGQTNVIPAMERAFEVLEKNELPGKGRLIYLLTDGIFNAPEEEVLGAIRAKNPKKEVFIYTYLYGHNPEQAEKVMKKIAEDNGGKYRYVSEGE